MIQRWMQKRYLITVLVSLGACILNMLQLNLSITIIQMTTGQEVTIGNTTYYEKPEFEWNSEAKGLVLSIVHYGVLFAPVGGILARKYGGATVFGTGIAVSGILTLLTPFSIRQNILFFIGARILEGLAGGITTTSLMEVFIRWTPPEERSRLIISGINGYYLGAVISHPVSGYIAERYSWEAVFFATGGIALVWFFVWIAFVSDSPKKDKFISAAERTFLIEKIHVTTNEKVSSYPWKSILTSKPVWALLNEYFSLAWSLAFVVQSLPLYINDVQKQKIESIGIISSIPNLSSFVGSIVAACICDYFRSRKTVRIHTVFKVFIAFGQLSTLTLLVIVGLWMNFEGSIICFTILRCFFSFAESSYEVLPADLAPQYAGVIRGMTITTMSIGLILSPTIMGFMVSDGSRASWNKYFIFLSVFNLWSLIIFLIFGSAELQPWARTSNEEDDRNKAKKIESNSTTVENNTPL